MKKLFSLLSLLATFCLFAQDVKTPEEIQQELDQAQRDFERAKEMFIPWYTGPLITASANNVPKGKYNVQGYLFITTDYAQFNDNRKSKDIPNIFTLKPLLLFQKGLLTWLDITVIGQGFFRWREGEYAQRYGDTSVQCGFQLVKQTPYVPSVRLILGESFPTGRYQKLHPEKAGIDASGSGAFETIVGLVVNKIFWSNPKHPVSVRFATTYNFPDHSVEVEEFNAYGGGFGTDGKICAGSTLNLDLGVEVSLTQKWVFASDVAYSFSTKSTFSGTPGFIAPGIPAANGGPTSDNLSLAPAIEYNVSSTGGFIGGVWFPITGRNSSNFISAVLSYTQLF